MTTEQAEQLNAIYDTLITPTGMYRTVLSSTNVASMLADTYIDYTKLTSDNFAVISISGSASTAYSTVDGSASSSCSGFTPAYNSSTGVLSIPGSISCYWHQFQGATLSGNSSISATTILFCDIAKTLKSNWKEFV